MTTGFALRQPIITHMLSSPIRDRRRDWRGDLYLELDALAFYYYAFYDLDYPETQPRPLR